MPYSPFVDTSFTHALLGYALAKLSVSTFLARTLPMLSGFFATYLHSDERPLHTVTFLTPINEDPSSESTAEACLQSTKAALLDSNYQREAVLVVDEKIYRSCVKVCRPSLLSLIIVASLCVGQAPSSRFVSPRLDLRWRLSSDEEFNDSNLGRARRIWHRRSPRSHIQGSITARCVEVRNCSRRSLFLTD